MCSVWESGPTSFIKITGNVISSKEKRKDFKLNILQIFKKNINEIIKNIFIKSSGYKQIFKNE